MSNDRPPIKPIYRFAFILTLAAVVFGGGYVAYQNRGKIIPRGNSQGVIRNEPVTTATGGTPEPIKVCVVTWGGYAGGQYFNGGFAPSTESRYFKEYGILVNFVLNDNPPASRLDFQSGGCTLHWTTLDSYGIEAASMAAEQPVAVFQSDWSRGGDVVVGVRGIKSFNDLRGKTVAVALDTPSGSFLLRGLESAGMSIHDIVIKQVPSAIDAASAFKAGDTEAAVVWSPDDADCLKAVPGSTRVTTTREATHIIADGFYAKKSWVQSHPNELDALIAGWLRGAAEINSNPSAKEQAIGILAAGLNQPRDFVELAINNARLTTMGDNVNFFDLDGNYKGVTGERLYLGTGKLFQQNTTLIPGSLPAWRQVSDTSSLSRIRSRLTGPEHAAEGGFQFTPATEREATAEAYASKPLPVSFASGSAALDENAKTILDMGIAASLNSFQGSRVRIEGNTDNTGAYDANKRLSRQRAESVRSYLVQTYGFDKDRFVVQGNGPDNPVASNDSDSGRSKNRRTDFEILR